MERKPSGTKILIVDDDEDVRYAASLALKKAFARVETEGDPRKLPALLSESRYDAVLLDMNFTADTTGGAEGFYWLQQIRERSPDTAVILVTAYGDVEKAVRAIKAGAADFVLKPWKNEKLLETVEHALRIRAAMKQGAALSRDKLKVKRNKEVIEFVFQSEAMKKVFETLERVAPTDADVLLTGENGTGKELAARALHGRSKRADRVFMGVDMGALSDTLFESELFGHKKGAFTDAKADRKGRFEAAHRGTLFLDEIGNLAPPLQVKLLAALQNREIYPVGSNQPVEVDVRLVCATNMPLRQMALENQFRQDLLYRINTIEIRMPALRERKEDVPLLARHFLQQFQKKYQRQFRPLDGPTIKLLQDYPWPGNVRELRHTVERAVILSDGDVLQVAEHLQDAPVPAAPAINVGNDAAHAQEAPPSLELEEVEKQTIMQALDKHDGNISRAAKELGLTRSALYRRLEKYDLKG